jgi:hypothetical protein
MHRNGTGHCGQCVLPHNEHAGKKDKKERRLPGEFDPPRNHLPKRNDRVDPVEEIRASLKVSQEKD